MFLVQPVSWFRAPTVAAVASKPTSHALPPRAEPLTQDKNSGKRCE